MRGPEFNTLILTVVTFNVLMFFPGMNQFAKLFFLFSLYLSGFNLIF